MKGVGVSHVSNGANGIRRGVLLERIERVTELPLLILAFCMIPLLLGPLLWDLSERENEIIRALDYFIWALFAIDLVIKLAIAPQRFQYLRGHWIDVLIVAIPFFRPLRLIRLLTFGTRAVFGFRRLVHVDFLLVYGLGLVMMSATIMPALEAGHVGANIQSFPDALWWSVVTMATVGYGDMFPVTLAGRAVAFVVMLAGIAFYSGVTANLASFLTKGDSTPETERQGDKLDLLLRELAALREEVMRLRAGGTG
ncbi:MAG: potassium channel family protein [Chloroflexi bacterium]|nr:potassium channel family protein [Chloroflexota bacterium]